MPQPPEFSNVMSKEEFEMLEALREEIGVESIDEVIRTLVRQAYYRRKIICPTCGAVAQATENDQAKCTNCLSILNLAQITLATVQQKK